MPDPMDKIKRLLMELDNKMKLDFDHYGYNHEVLGPAGQFADIWRKITPLRRQLWEGIPSEREDAREICMDLIGHCLLTVLMLDSKRSHPAPGGATSRTGDQEFPTVQVKPPGYDRIQIPYPPFFITVASDITPEAVDIIKKHLDAARREIAREA